MLLHGESVHSVSLTYFLIFCMLFFLSSSVFVSFVVVSLFFFRLLAFFWFLFALSWRGV